MKDRAPLCAALEHPNVRAFLAVVDLGEHGPRADDPDRYRTRFGGSKFDAPPWQHPGTTTTAKGITSTAAGRGQFLRGTWGDCVRDYGFEDFSPACQDEAIVARIIYRKALDDVLAGRLPEALAKCCHEWASLPGSPYGQPSITTEAAERRYLERGGQLAGAAPAPAFNPDSLETEHYGEAVTESTAPQETKTMPLPLIPLITAFGPQLVQMIPQLASLFGSGSDVQVRNAKAATMAVDAIVKATESPNLQAAVEKMQADPAAAKDARSAVAEVMALVEVGGGIEAARKTAFSIDQTPPWKNPAVIISILVLPLVYMVAVAVLFGVGGQTWSDDIKTLFVTAIVTGALGSITGFFLGSSLGSQRKTNLLGKE